MEFDKARVYTAVNAEELKVGSIVICEDSLRDLKKSVVNDDTPGILEIIEDESYEYRFQVKRNGDACHHALVYLVEEPKEPKLKWTDLKIGDVIRKGHCERMVIGIDAFEDIRCHISIGTWLDDNDLEDWEKVEDEKH